DIVAEQGRPRKYKSPKDFDAAVDAYKADCLANDEPITWTGLALALGFCSRQSIDEYSNYAGFSDSVKRAKAIVENAYEKRLAGPNAAGPIFALKNMGWKDKQETELTGANGGPVETVSRIELVAPDDDSTSQDTA